MKHLIETCFKKITFCVVLVLLCSFPSLSQAALIPTGNGNVLLDVNSNGILVGAKNVLVGGELYDVVFESGSYTQIFVDETGLDADESGKAQQFSFALLDQVLINTASLVFDSNPAKIFGCSGVTDCEVLTPYLLGPSSVIVAKANNSNNEARDRVTTNENGALAPGGARPRPLPPGSILVSGQVYANWSPAVVANDIPEPSTLLIIIAGCAALIFRRKLMRINLQRG